MTEEIFCKLPRRLMQASGYISPKDGKAVKLSATEKIIYIHLADRVKFFVGKRGGTLFESLETIAEACGVEVKTVGRVLKGFRDNGVVWAKKGKEAGSSHHRYYYTKVDTNLTLWKGGIDNPVKIPDTQHKSKKEEKQGSVEGVVDDAPPWYAEDEPF